MDAKTPHQVEIYFLGGIRLSVDPKNVILKKRTSNLECWIILSAEDEFHTPAGKGSPASSQGKPPLPPMVSPRETIGGSRGETLPRGASTSPSQDPTSPSNDSLEPVQTLSRFWKYHSVSYSLIHQVKQHWHPDSQNKSQDTGLRSFLYRGTSLFLRFSLTRQPRHQKKASQMQSLRRSFRGRWQWWWWWKGNWSSRKGWWWCWWWLHWTKTRWKSWERSWRVKTRRRPDLRCFVDHLYIPALTLLLYCWLYSVLYSLENWSCRERKKWRQMLTDPTYLDTLLWSCKISGIYMKSPLEKYCGILIVWL